MPTGHGPMGGYRFSLGTNAKRLPGDHVQSRTRSGSAGGGVAVRKAAGQFESLARAAGAGDQFELGAAARRAASHVAQAARCFLTGRGRMIVWRDRKTLAIVFDGDAAVI